MPDAHKKCSKPMPKKGSKQEEPKSKKRSECVEGLDKITDGLLAEWDLCPVGGCTYGHGHDGDHMTDDADLIPGRAGSLDSGFVNADRLADAGVPYGVNNADSPCVCAGLCRKDCTCISGCSRECDCHCADEAGPMFDERI